MNIIIVGMGKVGYKVAEALSDENNNVTVIDKDNNVLERVSDSLDVMCFNGNGVSVSALIDAGIRTADILIAVTASDEVNMVCCLMAKKLGAAHTIARIRELYYHEEIHLLKDELELDLVINPEEAAAVEISQKLKYSASVFVESFAGGGADLVSLDIAKDSILHQKSLIDIAKAGLGKILIVAVNRGKEVIVPNGEFVISEGDVIYITGTHNNINEFCKHVAKGNHKNIKVKNIMIVGGGKIASYLTELLKPHGIKAKVIERNEAIGIDFAGKLTNGIVIRGDGTDEELLLSENLKDMDALVALTGHDEDNLMASLLALQYQVPIVITKISRKNYAWIVKKLGIKNVVSPMVITTNYILKFVRSLQQAQGRYIEALYKILDNHAEVIEYKISSSCLFVNTPLMDLNIIKGVLVALIIRDKAVIIPHGYDMIKLGDHIVIISDKPITGALNDVFLMGGRK